jgi:predicted dehydrogenase
VVLVAWVDVQRDVAVEAAEALQLRDVVIATSLGEALAATEADFVVDVSVPEAHPVVTLEALSRGLPVLGEKPMADSLARAREMVAASERTGLLYMVSQSRRYHAGLAAYRDLIATHLGRLGMLNADFYLGPHFGGFRDAMVSPLVLDMAIHTFDAARYLAAADPVAVYCEEFNPSWSWYAGAASAVALFEMERDLRFTYRGSWCAEGLPTSWESSWRAVGEHGTALWDGHGAPMAETVTSSGDFFSPVQRVEAAVEEWEHTGIAASLRDFLRALETGSTPMGECHDNIKSLAMVLAAIESASTGSRVPVVF